MAKIYPYQYVLSDVADITSYQFWDQNKNFLVKSLVKLKHELLPLEEKVPDVTFFFISFPC
jgi:hypothetical protein